jgi:hypothetical protein
MSMLSHIGLIYVHISEGDTVLLRSIYWLACRGYYKFEHLDSVLSYTGCECKQHTASSQILVSSPNRPGLRYSRMNPRLLTQAVRARFWALTSLPRPTPKPGQKQKRKFLSFRKILQKSSWGIFPHHLHIYPIAMPSTDRQELKMLYHEKGAFRSFLRLKYIWER